MAKRSGGWKKGQSGNPEGKKPGTKNHVTRTVEKLLDGEAEAITRKAIELAKEGDTTAIRLCLERMAPPRRDRPITIELPPVESAEQVSAAMARIIAAAASGELTPQEAQTFASLLEGQRRTIELAELDRRIAQLESERPRQ